MIAALVLAALIQAAPAPAQVEETDIVVIGRRLAAVSVIVGRNAHGKFTCRLDQSSGNLRLDDQLCRTAAKCVRNGASDNAKVTACVDRRKPELLAGVRRSLAGRAPQ